MSAETLVSIVVATSRPSPFLRAALDSVVAQTHGDWELVIVDDGSPEPGELDAVAADYPGVRIIHQDNAGSSVARNVGVAASSGPYLVFLDDDDLMAPRRLELQVRSLVERTESVAGYCRMHSINEDGHEIYAADQVAATQRELLRRDVGVLLPNLMIKRTTVERIGGFHPAFRRAQDLDLILRAAADGPFAFVDEVLVSYRRHAGNVTRQRHELVRSIDRIVGLQRWAAWERGDAERVADHTVSLRANRRFAAWSASQSCATYLRNRQYLRLVHEVVWGARNGWDAPVQWIRRRLPRRMSRNMTS